jgi:hypothetical protein
VSRPIKCLSTHSQRCVTLTEGLGAKLLDLTCVAPHLVHLVKVPLFADDHRSCLFFQQDGLSFGDVQEFVIGGARDLLVLPAFPQDISHIMLLGFQECPNVQRRVTA